MDPKTSSNPTPGAAAATSSPGVVANDSMGSVGIAVNGLAADTTNPATNAYNQGGKFKEQLEAIGGVYNKPAGVEHEPVKAVEKPVESIEEVPANPEIEKKPELSGYIEKVEREPETLKPIVDDYTQQVLLKPVGSASSKVVLPLTEDEIKVGLHHKIWESVRWLAEWCVRQVKMLGGRAEYKPGAGSVTDPSLEQK